MGEFLVMERKVIKRFFKKIIQFKLNGNENNKLLTNNIKSLLTKLRILNLRGNKLHCYTVDEVVL